jgi:putative ubiquitin-RnfH superfamily antitoxin RatB of RatAB toxin-antitoxin module
MKVEVVYALAGRAESVTLEVAPGTTLRQAVAASGLLERHPGLDAERVGIFGESRAADSAASDGDRIELYRPLLHDPKEARRRRARRKS